MNIVTKILMILILAAALSACVVCEKQNETSLISPAIPQQEVVLVAINTELGQIQVELDMAGTPIPVKNFLQYVDAGLYNNIEFYRSINFLSLIGAGVGGQSMKDGSYKDMLRRVFPPAKLNPPSDQEKILQKGVIAYAHLGHAEFIQSEFLIAQATNPSLTYKVDQSGKRSGLIPFGRVVKGMDIVEKIYAMETGGEANLPWGMEHMLKKYIVISSIERL